MQRVLISLVLALTASVSVLAQENIGARKVSYHSQDIVPIRAKMKYSTLIEVPQTEKIILAATGDKEFWAVDVVNNDCFIHPAKAGISTDLHLKTDKGNDYTFTLQDISGSAGLPDLKVLVDPQTILHLSLRVALPSSFQRRSLSSRRRNTRLSNPMSPRR